MSLNLLSIAKWGNTMVIEHTGESAAIFYVFAVLWKWDIVTLLGKKAVFYYSFSPLYINKKQNGKIEAQVHRNGSFLFYF